MNKLMMLPLVTFTVACGGFEPLEGSWFLGSQTMVDDGCGLDEDGDDPDDNEDDVGLALSLDEEGGFMFSGGGFGWSCLLDGKSFTCDDSTDTMDLGELSAGTLEGTITVTMGLTGAFTVEDMADLDMAVSISCEGSGCETVGQGEACTSTMTATATWSDAE